MSVKTINEHAQAIEENLPKKHNDKLERSLRFQASSLAERVWLDRAFCDVSQYELFLEESFPFVKPKIGSPLENLSLS